MAVSFVCFFFVHLFVCGRVCVRVLACDIERKTERKEADIHIYTEKERSIVFANSPPSGMEKTLTTVPFSDAVASLVPVESNSIEANLLSWAGIIVTARRFTVSKT